MNKLPVEITEEIFKNLVKQHSYADNFFGHNDEKRCRYVSPKHCLFPNQAILRYFRYGEDGDCICWQLDILSVSMVCRSWYRISVNLIQQSPWLHLLNLPSFRRSYPFRTRLVQLLNESYTTNTCIRKQVKYLVIDFKSFDNKKDCLFELLILCPCIDSLNIVFDSSFQSESIYYKSQLLREGLIEQQLAHRIKALHFTSHPSLHDCTCCVGKTWDHSLSSLIDALPSLELLVLHNVLPSRQILEHLSQNLNLTRIVFHRAIVSSQHGFIDNIPVQLWNQVKKIEVIEDMEVKHLWTSGQYLNDMVNHMGPQLEKFVVQFSTQEDGDPCSR